MKNVKSPHQLYKQCVAHGKGDCMKLFVKLLEKHGHIRKHTSIPKSRHSRK